ncbi:MAG: hypothetical protein AAB657_04750 [Patescibacteria group bacterium]
MKNDGIIVMITVFLITIEIITTTLLIHQHLLQIGISDIQIGRTLLTSIFFMPFLLFSGIGAALAILLFIFTLIMYWNTNVLLVKIIINLLTYGLNKIGIVQWELNSIFNSEVYLDMPH